MVCIPVYGSHELFARCFISVLANTPRDVAILVADDATPDGGTLELVRSLNAETASGHVVWFFRQPRNVGFVANANWLFERAAPGDVVLLNSDCLVSDGWIRGLRAAARSEATIATASALTNHGTILSLPERNVPSESLPVTTTLDQAARAVRTASPRLRPRIPTAIGHCMYIRRPALDLVGGFDTTFSPGYGEEVDFSQRCVLQGLSHVAADDVFVFHAAGGTFGSKAALIRDAHQRIISDRYPYYSRAVSSAAFTVGPLGRSLAAARRAITGTLSVTIDGRYLGPHVTGTQLHTLGLVRGLSSFATLSLRIALPDDVGSYASSVLDALPKVERLDATGDLSGIERSDIVHRPYQVFDAGELQLLERLGERIIITQQDLIAYRNPGYFKSYEAWHAHREVTRHVLALADRVIFFSEHARQDALLEELVEPTATEVIYVGTDHSPALSRGHHRPEPALSTIPQDGFLLCLGTDFRHKNRVFALRMLDALQVHHDWGGLLVFAGPKVAVGSSDGDEAALLQIRPRVAEAVIDLGAVSEARKQWLLEQAELVVYPTLHEGFGLIPFEAAHAGTPCLFASQTSLAETLPPVLSRIVPWDPLETANQVMHLLSNRSERELLVEAVKATSQRFTWDATAAVLVRAYERTLHAPTRRARTVRSLQVSPVRRCSEHT